MIATVALLNFCCYTCNELWNFRGREPIMWCDTKTHVPWLHSAEGNMSFANRCTWSLNMIVDMWTFWSNFHRRCKRIIKKKKPCCTNLFAFRCIIKSFNPEVLIIEAWRVLIFEWSNIVLSKTTLLQRELFLRMFDTINSSPLLVTKSVFMLTMIYSNYQ